MKSTHWPIGFSATGLAAGHSKKKGKKDMALFYSHLPAHAGAVFTHNQVKAAPILVTEAHLLKSRGRVRAVAVNTGSANAGTGPAGYKDAVQTARWLAEELDIPLEEAWIASTGVIGTRFNLARYRKGLRAMARRVLKGSVQEGSVAAESIMTTDTQVKMAGGKFLIDGVPVRIWGCCKGSGMIHPVLRGPRGRLHATMLGFILTDASVKAKVVQRTLERVTDRTFNCVSIDGDTSTNDFVAVIANGASGAPEIEKPQGPHHRTFQSALMEICENLTTQMAMDGEGASRLVEIVVEGARSESSARRMAAVVASSPLVKTACHGADPNWGRILAAMGRSDVKFDLSKVRIYLGDMLVCKGGQEHPFVEKDAIRYLKNRRIEIRIHLGLGKKWSRYKTCDFTGRYVGINAGYRT